MASAIRFRQTDSDATARRLGEGFWRIVIYAILTVAAIQTIYPLIWIIFGSLKSDPDLFNNIWGPPRLLVWQNYADAWQIGQLGDRIANSIIVTALSLVLLLLVSSLAAYVLARLRIPAKQFIFIFFLITMMIPPEVTIIPLFLVVKTLGLLNSRLGLVLVYVASGTAFSTFLLRGFFLSIPSELEDAADDSAGAGELFLPLSIRLDAVFRGADDGGGAGSGSVCDAATLVYRGVDGWGVEGVTSYSSGDIYA